MTTLQFDDKQLQALVGLVAAAGSRLGDANIMVAAADMLKFIQTSVDAAKVNPLRPVGQEDQPERRSPVAR